MKEKQYAPTCITTKVLMFLAAHQKETITYGPSYDDLSVQQVFPIGTSKKDQLKFMKNLIEKGFVEDEGCLLGMCGYICHCPFDFCITDKGLKFLAEDCIKGEEINNIEEIGNRGS